MSNAIAIKLVYGEDLHGCTLPPSGDSMPTFAHLRAEIPLFIAELEHVSIIIT
jgi:hypothetical protein